VAGDNVSIDRWVPSDVLMIVTCGVPEAVMLAM
jgi:hypothetical protein